VSRRAVQIELRRTCGVVAAEGDGLRTLADVDRLFVAHCVARTVHVDPAVAADVDRAEFAPLQQIAHADRLAERTGHLDRARHRHHAADDDPVDMAIGQVASM
jgi:hypothetical protein